MIVIDVGNTNIVFGLYSNENLKKVLRVNTEKNKVKRQKKISKFLKTNTKIFKELDNKICILSSVVPSINMEIKNYFIKNKFKFRVINIKKNPLREKINYNINQIGSDRVANYAYVYSKKIKNCVIVDFGTATTFDVIKNNKYLGGLIFPGINLSMDTLIKNAELLKKTKISKAKKIVNNNTNLSLQSGFYFGYLHAINGIIKQIRKENNFIPKIIITGGLGKIFKDKIFFKPIYIENLTLEGIRQIGKKYYT